MSRTLAGSPDFLQEDLSNHYSVEHGRTEERCRGRQRIVDNRQATPYDQIVEIRSFRHKGLKRFYELGDQKGIPGDLVAKVRGMFAVLDRMSDVLELSAWPLWKVHQLSGGRKDTWSLHITRNWRLTFRVEEDQLVDVDFEDYH
ncbi:MAG: type II toxin-antitoxin system RelE/ParE family toxin [Bryobacteraceae bacterium]